MGTPQQAPIAPFGFSGELQDAATSLVYLRARWYHTTQGWFGSFRWRTSESDDTIPYTHHGYAYALSNPVRYIDPTGKYYTTGNEEPSGCPDGYVFDPVQYHTAPEGCIPVMLATTPPKLFSTSVRADHDGGH
jgi:RHS repeat-associated protein